MSLLLEALTHRARTGVIGPKDSLDYPYVRQCPNLLNSITDL